MTVRILHLFVIVALVLAAAYVYDIKFESTLQAERVAKLRGEIRRERDAVAALRAEWAKLDSPARVQSTGAAALAVETTRRAADRQSRQSAGTAKAATSRRRERSDRRADYVAG